ncbi:transketolase C-terminal domain-containing protein [Methanolobus sp. WCC1]|uniref:transketolase family protein n=1 Tax=unclassified Methanolobus TaxID=2629569 RepID=UPI0032472966
MSESYNLNKWLHTREAYGLMLVELGVENEDIVVLDSDLSKSTKTSLFADAFPERFINVGIAEQNLMNVASGLSRCNKVPFVSTYAMFGCGRGWEQIRNGIAIDDLNVKIVLTHGGLSLGGDGSSHQMFEDVALMRVIPNMNVIIPADFNETKQVIKHAAQTNGPYYIRLSRRASPIVFGDEYVYDPNDYPVVVDGDDVTIFSMGSMICNTLKACEMLQKDGINPRVVNVHTIKPIAKDCILKHAKETGLVVSVEDHNVLAGMGSAIAEVLIENHPVPMKMIGINDQFGGSGKMDELYSKYGLSPDSIYKSIKEFVEQRGL